MFDLDKAIVRWRKQISQRGAVSEEDLDELEAHIRDHVASQLEAGLDVRNAFIAATDRLGDPTLIAAEYRKVEWTKARAGGSLRRKAAEELALAANYAKVAARNLTRQRSYATINILGLAIGLACCTLIALYVRFELNFDRHHAHADRIYRVARQWLDENDIPVLQLARISMPIGPAMKQELPEVEDAVRLLQFEGAMAVGDKRFIESQVFVVDSTFFDVFSVDLIRGDSRALTSPHAVVLSKSTAQKYFGTTDPVGRSLELFDTYELRVTGVMQPQPAASHIHPDFLISFETTKSWTDASERDEWGQYNNYGTYVLLSAGTDAYALQAKLPAFIRAHYEPHNNTTDKLLLQPLTGIHLDSHLNSEFEPSGNRNYVVLFIAVALLVLLIACFNFVNLATARSTKRAKEVGLRKALGADRQQLAGQFLGEAVLLTLIALSVAMLLAWLALPEFARLTGRPADWSGIGALDIVLALVAVIALVSLLAGAYPAIFLSRFRPADALRQHTGGSWKSGLRSVLVVTQFAISIILMVGMGAVLRQLSYVQNKDLGFDKEQLVVLPVAPDMRTDFGRYRSQLEASPYLESVTASKLVPSRTLVDHVGVRAEVNGEVQHASLALNPVDHGFTETYGMPLVAGRSFSTDIASDSTEAFIINQSAVRLLGWNSDEEAVGRPFVFEASRFTRPGTVIGVVKDFHFESLRNEISPLVLFIMPERFNRVTVRIAPGRIDEALAFLEERWAAYRPGEPFTYSFVDEDFGALYEADRRVGTLFSYFSVLALAIAALGLLGLASFVTERRRKEISIRKVLGATVSSIVGMLSRDFLRLVGIAFLVACPLAFVLVNWWLNRFAYHVSPGLAVFVLAGLAVAVTALATVSVQSIRTAVADPVLSLRQD